VLTLPATSGTVVTTATSTGISGSAITTGTVGISVGGTGQVTATAAFNALNPMTTTGDIMYEASATTAARLGIGSSGQVLTVSGGIPAWTTISTSPATDFNAIGTYVAAYGASGGTYTINSTISGSSLLYLSGEPRGGFSAIIYGLENGIAWAYRTTPSGVTSMGCSGTWRCMTAGGGTSSGGYYQLHLWVRVS
jgi:hypothetical protein